MTEESTPLETTANAEIPVDGSENMDSNETDPMVEEAPPLETILEGEMGQNDGSESTEDKNQDINDSVQSSDFESIKAQLEDRTSQYMRLAADFDNFRKRTAKEKVEFEERSKRSTIIELLPIIDNFERARSQIKPQTESENNIQKSYQGIYKQLVDCLKQLGVSPMRPEGELFDPNLHEAVMREPTNEYPEGTVIEELRRGYILGDLVLRHAMVRVATPLESDSDQIAESEPDSESSEA
jgi:molecular chaperone GrpE